MRGAVGVMLSTIKKALMHFVQAFVAYNTGKRHHRKFFKNANKKSAKENSQSLYQGICANRVGNFQNTHP